MCSSCIFHYYDRWVVDANHFAGSTRFTGIPSRTNALVCSVIPVLVTLPNRSTGTCFQMPRVRKLRPDPHRQPYATWSIARYRVINLDSDLTTYAQVDTARQPYSWDCYLQGTYKARYPTTQVTLYCSCSTFAMHIPLRLPSVLAIVASYFVSDALAGIPVYHNGSAITHDPDYTNCINPTGKYHDPPPGALAEM